jgi:hypothetical protein
MRTPSVPSGCLSFLSEEFDGKGYCGLRSGHCQLAAHDSCLSDCSRRRVPFRYQECNCLDLWIYPSIYAVLSPFTNLNDMFLAIRA